MARINVNPTRMELARLKKSLASAQKGHKLLKDERDELMRRFLETVRLAKDLREKVEDELLKSQRYLQAAAAQLGTKKLKTALLLPKGTLLTAVDKQTVMSVSLPKFTALEKTGNSYSYGFAHTVADLDTSVNILLSLQDDLLRLAELEKSAELMAGEIERTRRRVNALEYVMIPDYQETIRYISSKLDENERSNSIRLLKVKDMVINEAIESKRRSD
ncbi:MAG: V-type ATP synthase subunit D [Clostridiales bacterium]|nr:V-type ATP synthase subunit D [Clostridiales bacterium]